MNQKWGEDQTIGTSGGNITYGFAVQNLSDQFGLFDEFITEGAFQDEVIRSLAAWENIANIRFLPSENPAEADIRFGWRDIDGARGVLGQTTIPVEGKLSRVVVALDSDENWFTGGDAPANAIDFSVTVTYEIGHAIGIDHSEVSDALMNASYSSSVLI